MVAYSTNIWLDWGFSIHVSHRSLKIFIFSLSFHSKEKGKSLNKQDGRAQV